MNRMPPCVRTAGSSLPPFFLALFFVIFRNNRFAWSQGILGNANLGFGWNVLQVGIEECDFFFKQIALYARLFPARALFSADNSLSRCGGSDVVSVDLGVKKRSCFLKSYSCLGGGDVLLLDDGKEMLFDEKEALVFSLVYSVFSGISA